MGDFPPPQRKFVFAFSQGQLQVQAGIELLQLDVQGKKYMQCLQYPTKI